VWRVQDGTEVAKIAIEGEDAVFNPDGNSLMGSNGRRWEVGTRREGREGAGAGHCFSPDGRMVVVTDADKIQRLVEVETGRTLARLESPDECQLHGAAFSPDGASLVLTTNDGPAVHVWDLRAIRRKLAEMGLDWNAPPYPETVSATENTAASPLQVVVDLGPLSPTVLLRENRLTAQADAAVTSSRWEEAAAAFARIFTERAPDRPEHWFEHAVLRLAVGDVAGYRSVCGKMLEAFPKNNQQVWLEFTAHACALAPDGPAEEARALQLAETRMSAMPDTPWSEHVLGLALYRAGRFAAADVRLRHGLASDPGWEFSVLDWLVLAMAIQQLGRPDEAQRWLERADRWVTTRLRDRPGGADRAIPENWQWRAGILLHLLLREARALIPADLPGLPNDVFAEPP